MTNKKNTRQIVTVIIGKSESSDDYGPWVFDKKPSDKFLKNFLKEYAGDDFPDEENGPGTFGSYIFLDIYECEIDKVK